MARTKKKQSNTEVDFEELQSSTEEINQVLVDTPILDTPSTIVFKDKKEVAVVETAKLHDYMRINAGLTARDIERILDLPCHINGWSLKTKK